MEKIQYHFSKAGPRLINAMVDAPVIDCVVTGPGMLIDQFKLFTNQDALTGCDAGFYTEVAADLEGVSYCGSQAPELLKIEVETHRLGPELIIHTGPVSMYQALIQLRTKSGRTFRELILQMLGKQHDESVIAVFYAHRAQSHHERHHAASKAVREHEQQFREEQHGH